MENKEMNVKELTDKLREEITSLMGGKDDQEVYEYIEQRILTHSSLQDLGIQQCKRIIQQCQCRRERGSYHEPTDSNIFADATG